MAIGSELLHRQCMQDVGLAPSTRDPRFKFVSVMSIFAIHVSTRTRRSTALMRFSKLCAQKFVTHECGLLNVRRERQRSELKRHDQPRDSFHSEPRWSIQPEEPPHVCPTVTMAFSRRPTTREGSRARRSHQVSR
jgi:hypothetical protein